MRDRSVITVTGHNTAGPRCRSRPVAVCCGSNDRHNSSETEYAASRGPGGIYTLDAERVDDAGSQAHKRYRAASTHKVHLEVTAHAEIDAPCARSKVRCIVRRDGETIFSRSSVKQRH